MILDFMRKSKFLRRRGVRLAGLSAVSLGMDIRFYTKENVISLVKML
jgi:hypothetical protein